MILQLGRTASVTAHSVTIPCVISLFVDMLLVLLWNKSFQNLHDSENWTDYPVAGLGIVPLKGTCLSLCVKKKKNPLQPGLETFTSWLECVAGQWGEWEMWPGMEIGADLCAEGEQQGNVVNHFMRTRLAVFVPVLETILSKVLQTAASELRILIKVKKWTGHWQIVSTQAWCPDHKTTGGSHCLCPLIDNKCITFLIPAILG